MNLSDIQSSFNRALSLTFCKKKLLLVFFVLAMCGLMVVFFRGAALNADHWILMCLSFLPFFLCAGVLLSMGIFLIRIYHDEIKEKVVSYSETLNKSWELIIGASYISIPIILSYLLLWILLGFFILLLKTPIIGDFFSVILALGPFLINLACLVLCLLNISLLFFITPIIALKGLNRLYLTEHLITRLKQDVFTQVILVFFALLPLIGISVLLFCAVILTGPICPSCENPLNNVLQWFFIMLPFTALLSPAVVFFFNFAAEAHVLAKKIPTTMNSNPIDL